MISDTPTLRHSDTPTLRHSDTPILRYVLLLTLFAIILFSVISCEKEPTLQTNRILSDNAIKILRKDFFSDSYFFDLNPKAVKPIEARSDQSDFIAEVKFDLSLKESSQTFIDQTTTITGYPVWSYSFFNEDSLGQRSLLIPFAHLSADTVNTFLLVHKQDDELQYHFEHRYSNLFGLLKDSLFSFTEEDLAALIDIENTMRYFDAVLFNNNINYVDGLHSPHPGTIQSRTISYFYITFWVPCNPVNCCWPCNHSGDGYFVTYRMPFWNAWNPGANPNNSVLLGFGNKHGGYGWGYGGDPNNLFWGPLWGHSGTPLIPGSVWITSSPTPWGGQLTILQKKQLNWAIEKFVDEFNLNVWGGDPSQRPSGYIDIEDLYIYALTNSCPFTDITAFIACMAEMINESFEEEPENSFIQECLKNNNYLLKQYNKAKWKAQNFCFSVHEVDSILNQALWIACDDNFEYQVDNFLTALPSFLKEPWTNGLDYSSCCYNDYFNEICAEQIFNKNLVLNSDGAYEIMDISNGFYDGDTAKIPSCITISDSVDIKVIFGITGSDSLSADQYVATCLIDALVYAIECTIDSFTIDSIFINCTTNGKHGKYSNHPKGLAIDLSRINGIHIVSMTEEQLKVVSKIQHCLEDYAEIRENFGPALKKKLNEDYEIDDHKDHIHFSINSDTTCDLDLEDITCE